MAQNSAAILVSDGEKLDKIGWVQKLSDSVKRWRRRFAVLNNFQLSFADDENKAAHYFIDLRQCVFVERGEYKTVFTKVPDVVSIRRSASGGGKSSSSASTISSSSSIRFFAQSLAENEDWRAIVRSNLEKIEKCEKFLRAVSEGSAQEVVAFIQNPQTKSFVNYVGRSSKTAVQLAASCGDEHVLQLLLTAGADVNIADNNGMTALHEAAILGNKTLISMLLEAGAHVCTATVDQKKSPLFSALEAGHGFEIACVLYQAGADVNFATVQNRSPLFVAVKNGDRLSAKLLLEAKADPNIRVTPGNFTPTFVAVEQQDVEMLQLLLDADPVTGIVHPTSGPALAAVAAISTSTAGIVGKYGVNVNITCIPAGESPLFLAVTHKLYDIAKLLLQAGADANLATRPYVFTPLYQAVLNDDNHMVKLLLEYKALPNIASQSKRLPIDVAIEKGNDQIVNMLEQLGRQEHAV